MNRIVIFGNSGAGKTTLGSKLKTDLGTTILDLDSITWIPEKPGVRRDVMESEELLTRFIDSNREWIIEGCYGNLIEQAAKFCSELVFLNPGLEKCLENNFNRPWEPRKYSSLEDQNKKLEFLQSWVKDYYSRNDECSYEFHKKIFDSFKGNKREIR